MAHLFRGTTHASIYSKFRPSPPPSLIEYMITYLKSNLKPPFNLAVDVGCGSGQSTLILSPYFENVIGFDGSDAQISNAKNERSASNIQYRVCHAENTGLQSSSVNLVTASQSLHWLDLDPFYDEVKRILVPNGVIAAYGYCIPTPKLGIGQKFNELDHFIKQHLYNDILGKYWDSRRKLVENQYKSLPFPFKDVTRRNFLKNSKMTVSDYVGYLSSWSAYQEYQKEDEIAAKNILDNVLERIMSILGKDSSPEETTMPIETDYFLLMGTKETEGKTD